MDRIHIVIGGAGVLLLVGFAAVLLEATYDAGFEQGFAQGRDCGRKEGTR